MTAVIVGSAKAPNGATWDIAFVGGRYKARPAPMGSVGIEGSRRTLNDALGMFDLNDFAPTTEAAQ